MKCIQCHKKMEGRADKKYCDNHCKSAYQYAKSKTKEKSRFQIVQNQLKINRKVLKRHNKIGKTTIRKVELLKEGFNPKYFTNYWRTQKGEVYWFVFEYGFHQIKERNIDKYVLVQWQDYME